MDFCPGALVIERIMVLPPPIGHALLDVGMRKIGKCNTCLHNSVTQLIAMRSFFLHLSVMGVASSRGFTEIGYVPESRVIFKKNR